MTTEPALSDRHLKYRPEVDGLRSVAILPVVLYHLNFPYVTGGFVGVDVFFVISGYLITKLIVGELDRTGSFSFSNFYVRRLRRLMPAFLCTAGLALIAGFLLFSPELFRPQGYSTLAAAFSLSNFYFWSKADYFDTLANTKPLLHTWSLAVEEQFYLLWPAIAVGLYKLAGRKYLPAFLLVTSIFSVAVAEYLLTIDRSAAFYLLPPRAFELGLGGLVVWLEQRQIASQTAANAIAGAGLLLIGFAIFAYSDVTPFPGLTALVPCLGAAMFIYAARQGPITALFRSSPLVWIGRISYSLYLVHWPIIVFYLAWTFAPPTLAEQLVLIAVCIAAGWLQFRLVEERFRYVRPESWKPLQFVGGLAAAAAVVVGLGSYVQLNKGLRWRIPEARNEHTTGEWRRIEREAYCDQWKDGLSRNLFSCQNDRGKAKDLFIWGDSHARHLVAGISEAYPDYNIYTLYLSGCSPQSGYAGFVDRIRNDGTQSCIRRNEKALEYFKSHPGANVILSGAKRGTPDQIAAASREILDQLKAAGANAVMLGDFIRPGVSLADCLKVPGYVVSDARIAARCHGNAAAAEAELAFNSELQAKLPELINPNDVQCPKGVCQFIVNGDLMFMDDHHLNVPGSIYFIGKMKDRLPF